MTVLGFKNCVQIHFHSNFHRNQSLFSQANTTIIIYWQIEEQTLPKSICFFIVDSCLLLLLIVNDIAMKFITFPKPKGIPTNVLQS